ncbi:hypothetical protein BDZ45DRAFT_676521 [Acephala macrosclerotiorum]|nr:hypothetical protein BDZ45DRAFT_676521 [Acephala macrosclerotiorum]
MGSSIRTKFFDEEYSIDKEDTIVLVRDDATSGWLLSSPSTTTFSTMRLSKAQQGSMDPYFHSPGSMKEFERRTVACRQTSKELQHRCSMSSDSSDPGLTNNHYASSPSPNSITSFEDPYNCNPSAVDLAAEKIWMQFFTDQSPIKVSLLESPLYHDFPPALFSYAPSEVHISPRNRSPIKPDTFSPYLGDLHRSDAARSSRDRSKTIHIVRPQPSHTAFPVAPSPYPSHQSWPQQTESRVQKPPQQPAAPPRPARSRAYTAPSQARVVRPSNLNACTSANDHPSIPYPYPPSTSNSHHNSGSNRFYATRSAPPTPLVLPVIHPTDIVEQFISHFDEDDDEEEHHSVFGSLKSRLCSRRGSSNASSGGSWGRNSNKAGGSGSGFEKRKKNPRKSLSELRDALKGCFGKTK